MNKNIIFFILAISIFSLIIVFPRLYETEEKSEIAWQTIDTAKNLCIALCESIKDNFTVNNTCLSDKDTITGVYWEYKNISCFVDSEYNPCIERGNIEIVLYDNCSLKDIRYVSKK